MALKFGALALLLVRADVLRASSPHVPFMCILWTLPRFYAYRLLSRSKSVHAILNYAAFYREDFYQEKVSLSRILSL